MNILSKIWDFICDQWALFLLGVGVLLAVLLQRGEDDYFAKVIERKSKQAEEEAKAIEKYSDNLGEIYAKNAEETEKALKALDEKHKDGVIKIQRKTSKRHEAWLARQREDPEGEAKKIADENNWEYVE